MHACRYCPQHDALLNRLTVREHLELFARIKGVDATQLDQFVQQMMKDLDLKSHEFKLAKMLSGGNKRKLGVGIALIGGPVLVFLDEPSTGVDPGARRFMWDIISRLSTRNKECTIVLTTHNMEEVRARVCGGGCLYPPTVFARWRRSCIDWTPPCCINCSQAEALCSRVGIMVGGRLRCFGSNQRLKAQFGQGYQLEIKLAEPTAMEAAQMVTQCNLPETVNDISNIFALCQQLGDEARAEAIREGCEEGYLLYSALTQNNFVTASQFATWWLSEDRCRTLAGVLQDSFPQGGVEMLERHDRSFRFRVQATSDSGQGALMTVADVFEKVEIGVKSKVKLEEYGLSQASLEQIFNQFAAMQEEETGAVRGMAPQMQQQPMQQPMQQMHQPVPMQGQPVAMVAPQQQMPMQGQLQPVVIAALPNHSAGSAFSPVDSTGVVLTNPDGSAVRQDP